MKTIISPSILAADFLNLEKEILTFQKEENLWLHLDIMDGHFVPNLTFGIPIIKKISKLTKLPLDAHLMVTNPRFHIDQMKDFGLHNITFHLEAVDNTLELIEFAKPFYPSVGISIKPATSFEDIPEDVLKKIDLLLVMSVEPGFGGQSFIEDSLKKVKQAKEYRAKHNLDFQIQIDGGINQNTYKRSLEAGCDNLVAGSYVFRDNYIEQINSIRG